MEKHAQRCCTWCEFNFLLEGLKR